MSFELTVLGCGSALPRNDRKPSAQLLKIQERHFLIDCGEGTQFELKRYGFSIQRIHHIFISHLHGDHFFGLPGLLATFQLLGREKDLHVHGPPALEELIRFQTEKTETHLRFAVRFHPTEPREKELLFEDRKLEVYSLPLKHRSPCTGFLFKEKPKLRKIRKEKLGEYEIPIRARQSLKEGKDVEDAHGRHVPMEELTDPPPPHHSYAYCSDTAYSEALIPLIEDVDLLYHEATFLEDLKGRARETQHSTARQAAQVAREAGAGRLLLGHYSARYNELQPFQEEARSVFDKSYLARDGLHIHVDDPEDPGSDRTKDP